MSILRFIVVVPAALSLLAFAGVSPSQDPAGPGETAEPKARPSVAEKTRAMAVRRGLLDFYVDDGRVYLALPPAAPDSGVSAAFIYVEALASGLGSNPIGLDRGQLGASRYVRFRRFGSKVLLEQPNLAFRARSENAAERRAVADSFAPSVLWGGAVVAEDPDGRHLVDLTSLVVSDAHGTAERLRESREGKFALDASRSAVDAGRCLAFPRNLVFEAVLTFTRSESGQQVRNTAASAAAITLTQHHQFIALPPPGFRPRPAHPRVGFFATRFLDYAVPLSAPMERGYILRHRLQGRDPSLPRSAAEEPIVYHVDRGAPPEIRDALIEGASWWTGAFEAAGFQDAFRVEVLPEGVNPLDARYNVIHWVHRSTRGWSYGGNVHDPRTGEILKGNVLLGSLRVRQDRVMFEALTDADRSGRGGPGDPVQIALARIRQLAAHEVGHTLGLAHNFAASSYGRASVMDYPAPLIRLTESGELDFSDAYAVGVGAWDVHTIRYGYTEWPEDTDESSALQAIVDDGVKRKLLFLSDADARPAGAAHPAASLWDNGADPVAELRRVLDVRAAALRRFGERNVAVGRPLAYLQEAFALVYLMHRYQVTAASKMVGGVHYTYASRRRDRRPETARPVATHRQWHAVDALLACLTPEALDVPDTVRPLLLPRPFGAKRNREMFPSRTGRTFDAMAAAAAAADHVLAALLHPERCARLAGGATGGAPPFDEVLRRVMKRLSERKPSTPRHVALRDMVGERFVRRLIALAADPTAAPAVRATAENALAGGRFVGSLHERSISRARTQWLEKGRRPVQSPPPPLPPGSPIGCGCGTSH